MKSFVCIITVFILSGCFLPLQAEPSADKIRVIVSEANVYLKPNAESLVILQVRAGAILTGEKYGEIWYKISLPPDKDGFVADGFVKAQDIEVNSEEKSVQKEVAPAPLQQDKITPTRMPKGIAEPTLQKEVKSYRNARISLATGEVIKTKRIYIHGSEIKVDSSPLTRYPSSEKQIYNLKDVRTIEVPSVENMMFGALAGMALGVGIMVLVESVYEKPKTTHESGPGWNSITTITKEMAFIEKVPIVITGAALGAWIGSMIRFSWKKIFPNDNLTLSFSLRNNRSIRPVVSLAVNF